MNKLSFVLLLLPILMHVARLEGMHWMSLGNTYFFLGIIQYCTTHPAVVSIDGVVP